MSPLPTIVNNYNLSSMFHKTMSMTRKKNCIRIFKPFGRTVSQNAVEAGCTEVRREGHVSTSMPPKSHVVDRHPFAEPPEGHPPTALCEISLHHPERLHPIILNDSLHHPARLTTFILYDPPRHCEPGHSELVSGSRPSII